jgi:phosphoglycolate phosphatase
LHALQQIHDQPGNPQRIMAVLTNKPVRPARGICEGLGLADYFLHIYGGNSFATKKPDPEGILSLMHETGARPDETVMIGDSKVDIQTARNAGAWALGCTFGYGPHDMEQVPPDILVDTAAEWTEALIPVASRSV